MKIKYLLPKEFCLVVISLLLNGCSSESLKESSMNFETASLTTSSLSCDAQAEQTDYSIYRMVSDGNRIGDVMPYYDSITSSFYVYYLKDIWNDAINAFDNFLQMQTGFFKSRYTYDFYTLKIILCAN